MKILPEPQKMTLDAAEFVSQILTPVLLELWHPQNYQSALGPPILGHQERPIFRQSRELLVLPCFIKMTRSPAMPLKALGTLHPVGSPDLGLLR